MRSSAFMFFPVHMMLILRLLLLASAPAGTLSLSLPPFGLGAVFFPVQKSIDAVSSYNFQDKYTVIQDASDFFVEAFWTGKVGGGAKTLNTVQRKQLQQSQVTEFQNRYGRQRSEKADLMVCRNAKQQIIACAGVEIDVIPRNSLRGIIDTRAPLMSNLAVSQQYRRRGLAEALVKTIEETCVSWGYDDCYLFVEKRNPGAIKLYEKLGYKTLWTDASATTLLPSPTGELRNSPTEIVCMKKENLRRSTSKNMMSSLSSLFGR